MALALLMYCYLCEQAPEGWMLLAAALSEAM